VLFYKSIKDNPPYFIKNYNDIEIRYLSGETELEIKDEDYYRMNHVYRN